LGFRLFGPNGPITIAELRAAVRITLFGQDFSDGHVTARLIALTSSTPVPVVRPALGVDQSHAVQIAETGPVASADPSDSRLFVIQAGNGNDEQATMLRRADLEFTFPIGTDSQVLAERERDDNQMPNGSWTKIFTGHDYAALAASADGIADYKAVYDAAGFTGLNASGQGFSPTADTLNLSGDFSAGFTLSDIGAPIGRVSLTAGNDYVLISDDNFVHGGTMMIIDGSRVGAGNHVMFDGSAETDGRFSFYGSAGNDIVFGGADNDWLWGLGGADVLTGGGGVDTFIYNKVSESTGANYDVLADFNPLADRIDLKGNVTGFDATLQTGTLSDGSFSHDLASALSGLGANHAALFRPDSGDLAGTVFLVVDANGIAGYQEGEDYVFALPATTLASLAGHTDFFV
jgi:Ca2+-binding RTX toxin-like protein